MTTDNTYWKLTDEMLKTVPEDLDLSGYSREELYTLATECMDRLIVALDEIAASKGHPSFEEFNAKEEQNETLSNT